MLEVHCYKMEIFSGSFRCWRRMNWLTVEVDGVLLAEFVTRFGGLDSGRRWTSDRGRQWLPGTLRVAAWIAAHPQRLSARRYWSLHGYRVMLG